MGYLIERLQKVLEFYSQKDPWALRLSGFLIALILISTSGSFGWLIERLALNGPNTSRLIGSIILIISGASILASKSLIKSIFAVLDHIESTTIQSDLIVARKNLSYIVSRNVQNLKREEILRATAETASENSVDGIFAPLFWMIVGAFLWQISTQLPGPLAFGWMYKASSTMDSMLGYKHGSLFWLGTIPAKLEDCMTWIPTRLVLITLPLVCNISWKSKIKYIKLAYKDGKVYDSPNAGISEGIFSYCSGIKMGGENIYENIRVSKPILSINNNYPDKEGVKNIIKYTLRLLFLWILFISLVGIILL